MDDYVDPFDTVIGGFWFLVIVVVIYFVYGKLFPPQTWVLHYFDNNSNLTRITGYSTIKSCSEKGAELVAISHGGYFTCNYGCHFDNSSGVDICQKYCEQSGDCR
jgi:hypothetical protein